jgi:hypothetical protein
VLIPWRKRANFCHTFNAHTSNKVSTATHTWKITKVLAGFGTDCPTNTQSHWPGWLGPRPCCISKFISVVRSYQHIILSSHNTAHDINSSSYASVTSHHHHVDSSCYGITLAPYISPIPVWYHIITIRFTHTCMASFHHFICPCMMSLPHHTHELLHHAAIQSFLDGINNIISCPIIVGNHILPHHCGESHPAPSLWGITSCPHHYWESHHAPSLQGSHSCPIIMGIIHHNTGSDKLFQFTRETTIVRTLT